MRGDAGERCTIDMFRAPTLLAEQRSRFATPGYVGCTARGLFGDQARDQRRGLRVERDHDQQLGGSIGAAGILYLRAIVCGAQIPQGRPRPTDPGSPSTHGGGWPRRPTRGHVTVTHHPSYATLVSAPGTIARTSRCRSQTRQRLRKGERLAVTNGASAVADFAPRSSRKRIPQRNTTRRGSRRARRSIVRPCQSS